MHEFFEEYGEMVISGIVAAALIAAAVSFVASGGGFLRDIIEQYGNGALTGA